jgi:protocatechuate 3,4-dioxygenase, beta subunit
MATYSIGDLSRREILRMSAMLGVTSVVSTIFSLVIPARPRSLTED